MQVYRHIFERIISKETLFTAWEEFRKGKQGRKDVQEFERKLEQNLFRLHRELMGGTYRHQPYSAFTICDPKQRRIHKATVQDRILHHAVFSVLNPIFEPTFIAHSFSCRKYKGTHKAVNALDRMLRSVSRNGTRPCVVLKCDIHQFFASVDHSVLLGILEKRLKDEKTTTLLREIIESFTAMERIENCKAGRLPPESVEQSLQSYLGVLSHADCYRLSQDLQNQCWFLLQK